MTMTQVLYALEVARCQNVSRAAERLLDVLGLVLPVALMGLGVVLFARGMGLALGVFGAWLALLQPGMTCQGGKHDVKYSYYHM